MTTWEWAYNGLTFGEGTDIDVVDVDGMALPPMRTSDVPRLGGHGAHPGRDLLDQRTVTMSLELLADDDTDLANQLAAVATATAPRDDELPLTFQLPGETSKQISCRPRRRNFTVDLRYLYDYPTIDLQFVASDPLIYSTALHATGTAAPTPSVGRAYDLTFPRTYGAFGSGGTMSLANAGTAPAPWQAGIVGPCLDPELITNDAAIRFEGTLVSGEVLTLDSRLRTVEPRFSMLRPGAVWFSLAPGTTTEVRFSTQDQQGAVFMSWRDAWW